MNRIFAVDQELIDHAKTVIAQNFTHNRHHVAVALRTPTKIYTSLHMDTVGFDVCAEPIAIHNALQNGETTFLQLVAVTLENDVISVIPPCGNCRHIMLEYIPDVDVIINNNGIYELLKPIELLPIPYQ